MELKKLVFEGERVKKESKLCLLVSLFLALFFFCIKAPARLQHTNARWISKCGKQDTDTKNCSKCKTSHFGIRLEDMQPQHQMLELDFTHILPNDLVIPDLIIPLKLNVHAWAVNKKGQVTEIVYNRTKFVNVSCPMGICEKYRVLEQRIIYGYSKYDIRVHLEDLSDKKIFQNNTEKTSLLCQDRICASDTCSNYEMISGWPVQINLQFVSTRFTQYVQCMFLIVLGTIIVLLSRTKEETKVIDHSYKRFLEV